MAKVTENERIKFHKITSPYREAAAVILKKEKDSRPELSKQTSQAALKDIEMADSMLNLASNYLVISGVSQSVQNLRNEDALNDARKTLYKSVIYLEEAVSNYVDTPFSDYEDKLNLIESINPARRFFLVRKLGLSVQMLKNSYGDNSKWKWSFVDLEGRAATVTKNIINLRTVMVNSDPRSPHYEPTILHLRLAKKLLMQAADRYREKYELSTNRIDDFRKGINFLSALVRLNMVTDAQLDAAAVKKKYDIWNNKLNADIIKADMRVSGKR
ncbi:MAG: hypothetical protein FWG46_05240 [Treponema sp.]|nr:hypothetical protein [Treponema sp.]